MGGAPATPPSGAPVTSLTTTPRAPRGPASSHDDFTDDHGSRTMRVLFVEHDDNGAANVAGALEREGYHVDVAPDLLEGLRRFTADPPDVVVLDVRPPGVAGVEVCRRMRAIAAVPVIMATTLGHEPDMVRTLELGAADQVTKPFRAPELITRIAGVLRPSSSARSAPRPPWATVAVRRDGMTIGDLQVDFAAREVTLRGRPVHLPRREFDLLALLLSPPGQLRTRPELVERLWSGRCTPGSRTLDTHVRRLRMKLEDEPTRPRFLVTVRGVGFRFDPGTDRIPA